MADAYGMPLRCLIVDDNSFFLEGASDLLRREGLDVVGVASNGAEAFRLAEELRPDVTLVDVDLGDEDGLELARQLNDSAPHSKVILISTHPESDMAHVIGASRAVGFIPKTRLSAQAILDVLEPAA
ncbi:MAG TPA: response regulator transcription factor [Gaiellaceae bacterium]|nr:response regulator transcription factor [Gaiellaceae bacterium]